MTERQQSEVSQDKIQELHEQNARKLREMRKEIHVYAARYGKYDEERSGALAFTEREKAKEWIDNVHNVLGNDAEWEGDEYMERAEDKIGNWAEVDKIRISDPEGLLAYDSE